MRSLPAITPAIALPYALALVTAIAVAFVVLAPPSRVQAQQPACTAWINGTSVGEFDSYGSAIKLPYTETVVLELQSAQPIRRVEISIKAGPYSRDLAVSGAGTAQGGTFWAGQVSLRDYAKNGVGLYQVTMASDSGCSQTLWVEVTGKSLFTTLAGFGASIVALLGAASQLVGFVSAVRNSKGRWWAILGGIPLGLGLCVLSQQAGITPITWEWAGIWTGGGMTFGGVIQGGLSALLGRNRYDGPILHAPPPEVEDAAAPDAAPVPPSAPPSASEPPSPPASATPPPSTTPPPAPSIPTSGSIPARGSSGATAPTSPPPPPPPPPPMAPEVPRNGHAVPDTIEPDAVGPAAGAPTRSARPPDAADDAPADPPRSAYALLHCPGTVVAEEEFELQLGLSPREVAGVAGPALVRPASSIGSYFLTVQIVAEGFDLRPGERWRHELPVTADDAYPLKLLHLTPKPQDEAVRSAAIQAIYSVSGQSMGFAVRPVAVIRSPDVAADVPAQPAEGATVSMPTDEPAADLTVRIQAGTEEGNLLWTFDTPFADVAVPDEPATTDIGDTPAAFARKLVDQMGAKEGQPGVYLSLLGIGKLVADQMPASFWDLFETIGARTMAQGRPPSVFFLSEDPYVPWELAQVHKRLDPALPEFLGAQAAVGRWALGRQRPKLPPPNLANVESMAVIWGEYNQPGWNRLLEAEQEAAGLSAAYSAVSINAARLDVLRCLNGTPDADVLHFAVHGIYDPNSVANGIVLVDGHYLDEFEVRGSNLAHGPFVFLNACQVGSGQAILGDYGGMAHAFLYAGAGGVVAPLWSIKDNIAREIATRFYEQAFAGVPPAEILRRERATFLENLDTTSATCMAYLWYGHPSFTLKRSQGDDQ